MRKRLSNLFHQKALGNIELLQLLLEYHADPNAGDPAPLWHAVMKGDVRAMECLLASGADFNTLFEEDTLLGLAVQRGEIQSVKLLLQYGADLYKLSSRQTLLEIARDTQDIQMIQFLTCLLEQIVRAFSLLLGASLAHRI